MKQLSLLFATQEIEIVVDGTGREVVQAEIFGQFAVHETLTKSPQPETWTVTHILSGLQIIGGIPEYNMACNLASSLEYAQIDCDLYWAAGRCASNEFFESLNTIKRNWERRWNIRLGYKFGGGEC